ncbi:MAG: adenosylcobinamide-GDP ribazoletransferase [Acidimicrobiia bacterium]|nr:MAG: adenosylcobinamide-GDP ribazoletransferase [Acidimicrobiia bacterium]
MRNLRMALAFLTRIPLTPSEPVTLPASAIALWFPIAGLVIGGLVGGVYWLAIQLLPAFPAAVIAIGFGVLITGAFHEDGLADTFDALGGGSDRDAVLRIFKDSSLGTFGVAALGLSILLRVSFLGALDGTAGLFTVMAAHGLGRGVAAATMGFASPAAAGLGGSFMSGFTRLHAIAVGTLGLAIGALLLGPPGVIAYLIATIAAVLMVRWATRKTGGITGDVLGAIEQLGEISVLVTAVATIDYWGIPWWN